MQHPDNLKNKVFSGVIWKGLERVCAQGVSLIVSITLARILVPNDYSVVSIATIFFSFCDLFISSGLNSALVQKKDSDKLDYSTIFVTNITFAFILYWVMFFCAPYIANLYDKPIVTPIIRVMALSFFINAYKAVLSAKVSSEMQFRKFFFSTIIGTVISAIIGIVMAIKGFGAWALVAQQMSNSLIDSIILTVTTRYYFGFRFSFARFKGLFKYGGKIFLASILSVAYDQCKPLIVGIKFSTDDLAYYNKGNSFPALINSVGNNTLTSALFPAMAKVQDDKPLILSMTRRFMRLSSFFIFPVMIGLFGVSENFVRVVLTEKWLPIVPYITVFCFSYMLDLIQIGNLQAIKALGRSDYILKMEIIKKVSYAIIIIVFVIMSDSPIALALSSLVCGVVATIVNTYPNKKLIGYSFAGLLRDTMPNLIPAAIMGAVVYFMNGLSINVYLLLVLQVFAGCVIYFGIAFLLKNENLIYIKDNYKSLLHRG